MNTPVLTAVQQKKTLSARKKIKKITIKNILASPYANYWPLINAEEATSLHEVLNNNLTKIKPTKTNVPWSDLKNIPRENRKTYRLKYIKDRDHEEINSKCGVTFGVNEVTKMLETNKASSILISADVNPQLMVKHVLDQAVLNNTPILIVPNLRTILKEKTGIASIAVVIETNTSDSNYLAIDQKIKEIYSNYPVPQNHIHSFRNADLPIDVPMDLNEDNEAKPERTKNLFLYRKSKSQRTFIPELSEHNAGISSTEMEVDNSEFLKFDDNKSSDSKKPKTISNKVKASYKSLVIKRVTNNKHRDMRKIEMLKGNK